MAVLYLLAGGILAALAEVVALGWLGAPATFPASSPIAVLVAVNLWLCAAAGANSLVWVGVRRLSQPAR